MLNAAYDGRLEDVKKNVQNGVDVNEPYLVNNYIYTYLIHITIQGWIFKLKLGWASACVVETGLAIYTALVRQIRRLCLVQPITREFRAYPQENFKSTHSEIESEGISYILLYIGIILALPYT